MAYVTGGRQRLRRRLEEWNAYERALIVRVDLGSGACQTVVEYQSPSKACPDVTPSHVFKCGSLSGNLLTVCTQTEVLSYRLPDFRLLRYVSLPLFNDLHHALALEDGRLLVANTGLDMVVEITADDGIGRIWSVTGDDPWARFSKQCDYRKVVTTKPHRAHPNHVFLLGDEIWTTRFEQRDAVCLTSRRAPISLGGGPHDGLLRGDAIYFTSVDGRVLEVDRHKLVTRETFNLARLEQKGGGLGWCRGLMLEQNRTWVGFSRLRPSSRIRESLRRSLGHVSDRPTRVAAYDRQQRLVQEINLERHHLNAVFSILSPQSPGTAAL